MEVESKKAAKRQIRARLETLTTNELVQHVVTLSAQVAVLQREYYVAQETLKWRARKQVAGTEKMCETGGSA